MSYFECPVSRWRILELHKLPAFFSSFGDIKRVDERRGEE